MPSVLATVFGQVVAMMGTLTATFGPVEPGLVRQVLAATTISAGRSPCSRGVRRYKEPDQEGIETIASPDCRDIDRWSL